MKMWNQVIVSVNGVRMKTPLHKTDQVGTSQPQLSFISCQEMPNLKTQEESLMEQPILRD